MESGCLLRSRQLYQAFAEPFDLPEMKLLIFHVSGHRDQAMIRPIWNKIFEDGSWSDVGPPRSF